MSNQDGKCLPPGRTCLSPARTTHIDEVQPSPSHQPSKSCMRVSLACRHGLAAATTTALGKAPAQDEESEQL